MLLDYIVCPPHCTARLRAHKLNIIMVNKVACVLLFMFVWLNASSGGRIVGGDVVVPHSIPYQVSLQVSR